MLVLFFFGESTESVQAVLDISSSSNANPIMIITLLLLMIHQTQILHHTIGYQLLHTHALSCLVLCAVVFQEPFGGGNEGSLINDERVWI